jgi:hypothetical protein
VDRLADRLALPIVAADAGVALLIERDVCLILAEREAMPFVAPLGLGDLIARDRVAVSAVIVAIAAKRRVVVVSEKEGNN